LEHKHSETSLERDRLKSELESLQENFHNVKQALNKEIETIREREAALKKTNDLLEKGLEEQKRANLDSGRATFEEGSSSLERNLILEERVAKAEADAEKVRAERLIAIESMSRVRN